MSKVKVFCLSLFVPFCLIGVSDNVNKERMVRDLETIKGVIETQYAPIEWKETYSGWSLNGEVDLAKARIYSTDDITVKDYQRIVRDFLKSTQDFHVSIAFYSTEKAYLPFIIKSAENRFFIAALDKTKLTSGQLQVGDEILAFNGQPINEALEEFKQLEIGSSTSLSNQTMAQFFFTHRYGSLGHLVPQGEVMVQVKPKSEKRTTQVQLNWIYHNEKIKEPILKTRHTLLSTFKQEKKLNSKLNQNSAFSKPMLAPFCNEMKSSFSSGVGMGDKKSFVPTLGKKIWTSHPDSYFYAYLFETPDRRRFGYIRIPEYTESLSAIEEFRELIERLEEESEALVIDQLNNPGGSVFYMYALLATLSDKPLTVPTHRITLTQKEVAFAVDALAAFKEADTLEEIKEIVGEDIDGYDVDTIFGKGLVDYMHFVVSQWNLGITFTSPFPIWGVYDIQPDKYAHYTKPILVLINENDFSCGDFFPSILQDNKRATLLGVKTGGAGGFVLSATYPNIFGIKQFSYTGSIAYRPDNTPLENLGVTPDINYEMSVEDMTNFYAPYKEKILQSLNEIKH